MGQRTTGRGLSPHEAFRGLVDHGLFSEKLPPSFKSDQLHQHVPTTLDPILIETRTPQLRQLIAKHSHDYIRYEYRTHTHTSRAIGIPHPESHLVQCLAIKRHWHQIKRHCAKPRIPISRIYVKRMETNRVFQMNYKGPETHELKKRDLTNMSGAQYLVNADISTCFPSIYTHSIPWALHGRSGAKTNRELTLPGNLLDRATQATRDSQTNGLLIGPHTSNVISELILTDIDRKLIDHGHTRLHRHIDDYTSYATTHNDAEVFLRNLELSLREYELSLNSRKTTILPMPRPLEEDWIRELNSSPIFQTGSLATTRTVELFLDLALDLVNKHQNSAILNYAFKMMPQRLSQRAAEFFVQHAANLTLQYPYLAPVVGDFAFEKYQVAGIKPLIQRFVNGLLEIAIQKVYSDSMVYALYHAIVYKIKLEMDVGRIRDAALRIDDCITYVLLREYGRRFGERMIVDSVRSRAEKLKGEERREQDRFWLLIYQIWRADTLNREGQGFLAGLKRARFAFLDF